VLFIGSQPHQKKDETAKSLRNAIGEAYEVVKNQIRELNWIILFFVWPLAWSTRFSDGGTLWENRCLDRYSGLPTEKRTSYFVPAKQENIFTRDSAGVEAAGNSGNLPILTVVNDAVEFSGLVGSI